MHYHLCSCALRLQRLTPDGLRSFSAPNGDYMVPDGESGFAIEPIDEFAEHGNEQAENGSQKHSP